MISSHHVHSLCFNKDSFANKEIKFSKVIFLLLKKTLKINYWWLVKKEKQISYILKFWNAAPQTPHLP